MSVTTASATKGENAHDRPIRNPLLAGCARGVARRVFCAVTPSNTTVASSDRSLGDRTPRAQTRLVCCPRDPPHNSGPQPRPEDATPDPSIGRVPPSRRQEGTPCAASLQGVEPPSSGGRPGARLGGFGDPPEWVGAGAKRRRGGLRPGTSSANLRDRTLGDDETLVAFWPAPLTRRILPAGLQGPSRDQTLESPGNRFRGASLG